eukprot:TRINITY_DN19522_c0_g1_i1.p1 TRINITY_DN19522_c0_g1~~TRINITY_DN19522_c0_g1_i1.p1  ORF type:complete len:353 (-),score=31.25 TRINITY_DN19522_c0_g1_i1:12-1070(-)
MDNHTNQEPKPEEVDSTLVVPSSQAGALLSWVKNLKPGADCTRVSMPAVLCSPLTQLEMLRKALLLHSDLLLEVPSKAEPIDRMLAVVKYYITHFKPPPKTEKQGKPLNPVQSETCTCTAHDGKLAFVAEQVSHHPPISMARLQHEGLSLYGGYETKVSFALSHVRLTFEGDFTLNLGAEFDNERYTFTTPGFSIRLWRLFGEFDDTVQVRCEETGLVCELVFVAKPIGTGKVNALRGKLFFIGNEEQPILTLKGHWDKTVYTAKADGTDAEVLVDVQQLKEQSWEKTPHPETDSEVIWKEAKAAIYAGETQAMASAKHKVEEAQRELRKDGGLEPPVHFSVNSDGKWAPFG